MVDSTRTGVSKANAERVYQFFAYFYEWVRFPSRRQLDLRLTGLPQSGSTILHRLTRSGPMSVRGLAQSLTLDQSTVSRQLEPLREAGLVDEEPFENNRRSTQVSINSHGRMISERVSAYWIDYWTRVMGHLTPHEQREIAVLLERLQQAIAAEELSLDGGIATSV